LQEFVLAALRSQGFKGMCDGECGCGIEEFAPCGDGPYSECAPAYALLVPENGVLIDPQDGLRVSHDGHPGDVVFVMAREALREAANAECCSDGHADQIGPSKNEGSTNNDL
jgi:hypothetical protein